MILLGLETFLAVLFLILEIIFTQNLLGIFTGIFFGLLCGNILGILLSSTKTGALQKPQTSPIPTPSNPELPLSKPEPKKIEMIQPKTIPNNNPEVAIPITTPSTTRAIMSKSELMSRIIKLSEIVQSCQDLVENETELSKKEEARLYLRRDEFKKLFRELKSTTLDSF